MTKFICQQCGYESPQWLGKCPECGTWNSLVETIEESSKFKVPARGWSAFGGKSQRSKAKPQKLSEIKYESGERISTGFRELDRALGGGIVKGQVTLLAGDPGIGKSTLALSVTGKSDSRGRVLYISAEESPEQIKMRAHRLGLQEKSEIYVFSATLVEEIVSQISQIGPISLIIVDSIQGVESGRLMGGAGSVGQVRECASQLAGVAKSTGTPLFLIGHVTKEGTIAGPMVLSHMVDTVLFIEGEQFKDTRIIRVLKNRFGPIDEVGIFEMKSAGITEVKNPSEFFLGGDGKKSVAGSVVVASTQGSRPILAQLEALVLPTKLVVPRRTVLGLDLKRVELLAAVLQKTCRLPLDRFDIFISVTGGITLREPGIDLGICLSIFSSFKNIPLKNAVAIAEVGLLGGLRSVPSLEKRVAEAERLGFKTILTAKNYRNLIDVLKRYGKGE